MLLHLHEEVTVCFWESPNAQDNDSQLEIRKEMAYKLADVEHISILETIS